MVQPLFVAGTGWGDTRTGCQKAAVGMTPRVSNSAELYRLKGALFPLSKEDARGHG
jgi:hypothetical protein